MNSIFGATVTIVLLLSATAEADPGATDGPTTRLIRVPKADLHTLPRLRVPNEFHWLRQPTEEEIARYFPDLAERMETSGRALIDCKIGADGNLNSCALVSEEPAGMKFGEAALSMASNGLFRVDIQNTSATIKSVRLPIAFHLSKPIPPSSDLPGRPTSPGE